MARYRKRSYEEEEYTEFLNHIKEEKEETSNFAKSLFTFVLGACCVIFFGLWFIQNDSLIINLFGEDSEITRQLLTIGHTIKEHHRSNSWSFFGRQQNILLLGVDSNGANTDMWKGTRSDTIIILNVDPSSHSINAISIPRDSKVYLPDGHGTNKINAAHAIGGVDMTIQTVEETLGIKIDKYVCVHDEGVVEVIDALGGIPIYVEKRMKYDDFAGKLHVNLDKGNHVLSGKEAIGYLRYRHDALGDIGRTQRQQWFLRGFMERLQSPQTIAKIPQMINISKKYIKTNLSVYEMSKLAAIAKGLDESNIQVAMLPGGPNAKGGTSYWILDPDKVQDVVNRLIYREEPIPDKTSQIVGGILYTNNQKGQANALKSQLMNMGYRVNMIELNHLPHTQFIAHNNNVTTSFYKNLKQNVPYIKKTQYIYDPNRMFCAGSCDFTIILSGK